MDGAMFYIDKRSQENTFWNPSIQSNKTCHKNDCKRSMNDTGDSVSNDHGILKFFVWNVWIIVWGKRS